MKFISLTLAAAVALCGCASEPRRFAAGEAALGSDGSITSLYHAAIYYPSEVGPKFDGYLVGVEKIKRGALGPLDTEKIDANQARLASNKLGPASKLDDGKLMMVTHVVKTHRDISISPNCLIFNAYNVDQASVSSQALREGCAADVAIRQATEAYSNSWTGMDILREAIAESLVETMPPHTSGAPRKYTHLLVVVLGWNTVQEEAARNINSIAFNLIYAKRESQEKVKLPNGDAVDAFRPLVIGMTWPSQWNSKWADPVVKLASFGTKADDADEVGMTWLGTLLHEIIPEARMKASSNAEVVAVGHSFGSRAVTVAACGGPAIARSKNDEPASLQRIGTVINWQGAFMAKRLFGLPNEGLRFESLCDHVDRFVMTSSKHDAAVKGALWGRLYGEYVGDDRSFAAYCGNQNDRINCGIAQPSGKVELTKTVKSNIYYVNADRLIAENAFETGGGAHSDIYRLEHGRLIGAAMDGFPATKQ